MADYLATVECLCGFRTEFLTSDPTRAEFVADRHENERAASPRAYRHQTRYELASAPVRSFAAPIAERWVAAAR